MYEYARINRGTCSNMAEVSSFSLCRRFKNEYKVIYMCVYYMCFFFLFLFLDSFLFSHRRFRHVVRFWYLSPFWLSFGRCSMVYVWHAQWPFAEVAACATPDILLICGSPNIKYTYYILIPRYNDTIHACVYKRCVHERPLQPLFARFYFFLQSLFSLINGDYIKHTFI